MHCTLPTCYNHIQTMFTRYFKHVLLFFFVYCGLQASPLHTREQLLWLIDSLNVELQQQRRQGSVHKETEKQLLSAQASLDSIRGVIQFAANSDSIQLQPIGTRKASAPFGLKIPEITGDSFFDTLITVVAAVAAIATLLLVFSLISIRTRKRKKRRGPRPIIPSLKVNQPAAEPTSVAIKKYQAAINDTKPTTSATVQPEPSLAAPPEGSLPADPAVKPAESTRDEDLDWLRQRISQTVNDRKNQPKPPALTQSPPQEAKSVAAQESYPRVTITEQVRIASNKGLSPSDIARKFKISVDQVSLMLKVGQKK